MTFNEERLRESAQRLALQDNRKLRVPDNPLYQKRTYWGWLATPAAAVAGIVLGMSVHLIAGQEPELRIVQTTDTVCIERPVCDTVYLTKVVEKVRTIAKPVKDNSVPTSVAVDEDTSACTSVACDGINYAALTLN